MFPQFMYVFLELYAVGRLHECGPCQNIHMVSPPITQTQFLYLHPTSDTLTYVQQATPASGEMMTHEGAG